MILQNAFGALFTYRDLFICQYRKEEPEGSGDSSSDFISRENIIYAKHSPIKTRDKPAATGKVILSPAEISILK